MVSMQVRSGGENGCRSLGAAASRRQAEKGAEKFKASQERMLSWKPSAISEAPGRKQVAHTRRITKELNEGTIFKGMTRLKRTKLW